MNNLPMTISDGDGKAPKAATQPTMFESTKADNEATFEELHETVEALPPLPTVEEAELGELARVEGGQFQHCTLLEEGDSDLIAFITEGDREEATDQEVRGAVLAFERGENQ